MPKIAIIGATGYTGQELARLIQGHPEFEICFVSSESYAGKSYREFDLSFPKIELKKSAEFDPEAVDLLFSCAPELQSSVWIKKALSAKKRVIDLSGNYRLKNLSDYKKWYAADHPDTDGLEQAVYGLPELYREAIPAAQLIANPGCYPTSIILGLAPLRALGLSIESLIADSKSGVSGAGASPKRETLYVSVADELRPYKPGSSHRHWPEVRQELGRQELEPAAFTFVPQVLPCERGILSNLYVALKGEWNLADVRKAYSDFAEKEYFFELLEDGALAKLSDARHSNRCVVSLSRSDDLLLVTSVIDNLRKGAAGQALQNANLLYGFEETTGLL